MSSKNLKVAIVHDFLFQYGGAEKVVEAWLEMYPKAQVYTSFAVPEKFAASPVFVKAFGEGRVKSTWAQKIFDWKNKDNQRRLIKFQKHLFWLYPLLMRFKTVKNYDLVLISSTDCAKQVRYGNCKKLIHYCHTPTRYLHGLTSKTEHQSLSVLQKFALPIFTLLLKPLDYRAAKYLQKQNCFWLANSEYIQATIWDKYQVRSEVMYPPVETEKFKDIVRKPNKSSQFYLCHGRVSFHKRIDLAIMACLEAGKALKISGTSALEKEMEALKQIVEDWKKDNPRKKAHVEFLGRTTDKQLGELMSKCRAFIFPGKEDFGISPVEMLSAGVPVIAYAAGGALEYVRDGKNGVFFENQTIVDLVRAIEKFEAQDKWEEKAIRKTAQSFSKQAFIDATAEKVKQIFRIKKSR
jgi:glycosyltransferase involved in cell wall biosynthesis